MKTSTPDVQRGNQNEFWQSTSGGALPFQRRSVLISVPSFVRELMGLNDYRRKRDFSRTSEPTGGKGKDCRIFVVQKHDASRLHYDFRLEFGGVLWSWAVPKGPALDPAEKRLAVQVEDHPLDYHDFEGLIPQGEYGGGTVMVWDSGHWEPQGDPAKDYQAGKLKFILHGEKLKGGWTLVRMKGGSQRSAKPQWLLIKERDEYAKPLAVADVLEKRPKSVKTGRSLEEIAKGKPPVRKTALSSRAKRKAPAPRARRTERSPRSPRSKKKRTVARGKATPLDAAQLTGARQTSLPSKLAAELATLVAQPPAGDDWLHEIKFDGYRMFCRLDRGQVEFISRNGRKWTDRLANLVEAAAEFPAEQAILDGEVVVLDKQGVSNFQSLQNALGDHSRQSRLTYFVFDLLYLDGYDLRAAPLRERKALLKGLLRKHRSRGWPLRLSDHLQGSAVEVQRHACRAGLEGIVSKRANAPYRAGRGGEWVKSKCRQGQEFVIAGFTKPGGSRTDFGSLLLGYHRPDGKLAYAGRVGTGFSQQTLRELSGKMRDLQQPRCPFADFPRGAGARGVHWLTPTLVAQVEFNNWTQDGLLRQAAFQGLRDDKPARAVTRERPVQTADDR